ncbi:DUF6544 family protein [Actinotalea sp. Marseille-Q4924]|uniref:DUF6544 family protein n=1 Tax=Actinotalea sp. Marseille-Q4924 TaxID=2866571 RepID=UPI001CE41A8B|nr:DUF6544 family protein [Actinotalea sp. Marseille-Q4924]
MTALLDEVPRALRADWRRVLGAPAGRDVQFDPAMTDGLPAAVERWMHHALRPGVVLHRSVVMRQHGEIRLRGRWWPFRSVQALDPFRGYVWPVRTRVLGLPLVGHDALVGDRAAMRHRLLGLVPVVDATGPDLARSAVARAASEICFVPAAALDPRVSWSALSDDEAVGAVELLGHRHELTVRVDGEGRLLRGTMPRWASVDGGPWQLHPFGAVCEEEWTVDGVTVPRVVVAGYGPGESFHTDGAFIRLVVDDARYA